jgi:putative ABC transport system permease protein
LIIIASLLGIPLSWYLINKWLDGYAFKIELTWWMFLIPVLVVIVISLISISYLTIKAAVANPVKSLRYE